MYNIYLYMCYNNDFVSYFFVLYMYNTKRKNLSMNCKKFTFVAMPKFVSVFVKKKTTTASPISDY